MSSNWNDPNSGQPQNNGWDQGNSWNQQNSWDQQGQPQANSWDQGQANSGWNQGPANSGSHQGPVSYGVPVVPGQDGVGPGGHPLADWGKRALGGLLDFVLPTIVIGIALIPLNLATSTSETTSSGVHINYGSNVGNGVGSIILYLILAAVSAKTGQTWGRKIAKTQLVDENGVPLGFGKTFIRYLAHYIDSFICLLGWLFPLWDAQRQTIADKIMKTYVIDLGENPPMNVQQ